MTPSGDVHIPAAGRLADLVVLDGDPLVDVRNVTRLHRVVKDGVIFDPVKLLAGG